MGTGGQDARETETGDWNGKCALLALGILEDADEANRDSVGNEDMTSGPGTAALTSPHRGTAAGIGSEVKP